MEGIIEITYTVLCSSDTNKEITINEILSNEKIVKLLKSEFTKGLRNMTISPKDNTTLLFKTQKVEYKLRVSKNDFQI